jgi:hypothetical protein
LAGLCLIFKCLILCLLSLVCIQEKGKAKTLSRVISCNDLGIGVAKMYQMLHQQWATKRRMYNISGGASVVLHISEEFNVPLNWAAISSG